jgi:hypothetical protein
MVLPAMAGPHLAARLASGMAWKNCSQSLPDEQAQGAESSRADAFAWSSTASFRVFSLAASMRADSINASSAVRLSSSTRTPPPAAVIAATTSAVFVNGFMADTRPDGGSP